jgi:hypothetical protein
MATLKHTYMNVNASSGDRENPYTLADGRTVTEDLVPDHPGLMAIDQVPQEEPWVRGN